MKLKLMEIVQQLDYLSEDDVKKGVMSGYIQDYCYILHDKDKKKDGTDKASHWHIFLRLKDSTDTKYIASAFGVKEQYINRVKGKWVDVLLYATHRNATDKYLYDDSEVVSNFDFSIVRDKELEKKNRTNRVNEIVEGIVSGEIREFNYNQYISGVEYTIYKNKIESAFKYRLDNQKGKNRNMDCVYICGTSGSGKTTYAKRLAESKNMSYFISSGSNDVLDDYKGQDCIILDDLRPSCMGLCDLLKMLDNNTASSVKSRFKNKVLECRLIIITTTLDIENFFRHVFSEEPESAIQLYRRCQTYIKMDRDKMEIYAYQPVSRVYVFVAEYENPVKDMFLIEDKTSEECIDFIDSILGSTLVNMKKIRDIKHDLIPVADDFVSPFDEDKRENEQISLLDYIK